MTAVDPHETAFIEPRLDLADRQRAEQFGVAVEDISVMRIGMHRDHLVDRDEMRGAIALDRQMARDARRRRAGAAERRIRSAPDVGLSRCAAKRRRGSY